MSQRSRQGLGCERWRGSCSTVTEKSDAALSLVIHSAHTLTLVVLEAWQLGVRGWIQKMKKMKPTSVAALMKRAREARHDALGLANDLEARMALASVHRNAFVHDRAEHALRRWRELVSQIAADAPQEEPALLRWLAIEHVRLAIGLKHARIEDAALNADVVRWSEKLDVNERTDEMKRFELDMAAPLTVGAVASRG